MRPPPSVWVTCPRPSPGARLRLFCFPYAGAGSAAYRSWPARMPDGIEVCLVNLPGREGRIKEPPHQRLGPLVRELADGLGPWLSMPYALFGHSMGALIAFELARELRRQSGRLPSCLLVSGRRAPHLRDPDPLSLLPDAELCAKLRKMDGTPEAVLREPELMALFLPILRADLALNDESEIAVEPPFDFPIRAYGGLWDERASRREVEAWRVHTRGEFSMEMFHGGHFYLKRAELALLESVSKVVLGSVGQ